jgi:queuosine precursor transporter
LTTEGRFLWIRTIASTLVGQGIDSAIFISIAFYALPASVLIGMIVSQWLFKSGYEALATPLTYTIVNALKRAEGEDYFDRGTNFNPLQF